MKRTKLVAFILRLLNPAYSTCRRCGLPWNHCTSKAVETGKGWGTFATCDVCWGKSTLAELHQYYIQVYMMQSRWGPKDYTLAHLLTCVTKEFNNTQSKTEET